MCCSDKLHCCAEGETCNTETGQCDNHHDNTRLPWQQKMPANTKPGVVVCPDGSSQCPTGSTCCQLATGQYACCPLPKVRLLLLLAWRRHVLVRRPCAALIMCIAALMVTLVMLAHAAGATFRCHGNRKPQQLLSNRKR